MTKKIAAYLRVSTDLQSTDHQRQAIISYAATMGIAEASLLFFSDDGITGAKSGDHKRSGMKSLMQELSTKKFSKLFIFESSRASRDFLTYLNFLSNCRDAGVTVDVVGKGEISLEKSEDWLMASIAAFLGQAERERISQRTKSGLEAARLRGAKLGARSGNSHRKGKLKEYPQELVREVLKLRMKGLSYRDIASTIGTRFSNAPLSFVTIRSIFLKHE